MTGQSRAWSRPIDRRHFMRMCAGCLALAAIDCRRRGDPAYARRSTLVMGVNRMEDVTPVATPIAFLRFPRLAALDENGDLEPRLAQSWEHSPDYREWTYHLRTDVRWDDGKPVTAHDVKFTLDLLGHPDVAAFSVESAAVIDDFTVKIRKGGILFYQDDMVFYPKHVLEHLDPKNFWDWAFWLQTPASAGPYRFARYVPETMMEFEANPRYFRGKPKIERLVLKFVGQAGLTELLNGNIDVGLDGQPAQIPFVEKDPRFRLYHRVNAGVRAIYWKCDHPLLHDVRVRRALTLAIDRRELLGVLHLPSDLPISDGMFTIRQFMRRQLPEPLPYDSGQSRALLEAAGWKDRDGDGVREREGRPFRFTALVRGIQGYDRLAVYVQAQLRQVGVQMEVQILDPAALDARRTAGDFEAIFSLHQPVPDYQPQHFGRNNPNGYRNPEVVRLIDQAMATADPDQLDHTYRALTEIFRADLPMTRLVPNTVTAFVHRRVGGLSTPNRARPDQYIEELWLDGEP